MLHSRKDCFTNNNIGKVARCDDTQGKNLTDGKIYKILDHLWDKDGDLEHYVTVKDDNSKLVTLNMDCFFFSMALEDYYEEED